MALHIQAYVGLFTKPGRNPKTIRIDCDRSYVWDGVFEHAHERFGPDCLPDGPTRVSIMSAARKLGYSVVPAMVSIES